MFDAWTRTEGRRVDDRFSGQVIWCMGFDVSVFCVGNGSVQACLVFCEHFCFVGNRRDDVSVKEALIRCVEAYMPQVFSSERVSPTTEKVCNSA